jgi:hypothetical protein
LVGSVVVIEGSGADEQLTANAKHIMSEMRGFISFSMEDMVRGLWWQYIYRILLCIMKFAFT